MPFPVTRLWEKKKPRRTSTPRICGIIDPLDGTNNFAHKVPHFAVSIAHYRGGEPQCGVIVNPVRDEWYLAAKGQGATFNGDPVRRSPITSSA